MKYLVNEHSYQGFGGETTDMMREHTTLKAAYDDYAEARHKRCDYKDSFVQLFAANGSDYTLVLAYYSGRYAERNPHEEGRFRDGEYRNGMWLERHESECKGVRL